MAIKASDLRTEGSRWFSSLRVFPQARVRDPAAATIQDEEDFMNQIRLIEPGFSDSIESAFRRLLAPWNGDIDTPSLRMRIDVTETPQA